NADPGDATLKSLGRLVGTLAELVPISCTHYFFVRWFHLPRASIRCSELNVSFTTMNNADPGDATVKSLGRLVGTLADSVPIRCTPYFCVRRCHLPPASIRCSERNVSVTTNEQRGSGRCNIEITRKVGW